MLLNTVTPLLLTFNEEPNIERTLAQLTWAERVVVVDSFSTDRTVEIVRANPRVELFQRRFDNHTNQWNYGLDQVRTPWVLSLDADYVLPGGFTAVLADNAFLPDRDGYYAPFRYCVAGRPLRGSLYPPRVVLFRSGRARYVPDGHTQRLAFDGEVGWLPEPILHDDRKPLAAWLQAQARYTELELEKLLTTPRRALGRNDRVRHTGWLAPLLVVPYCLLARRLIFDGAAGWTYTMQRLYAELLLALKLAERRAAR